MRLTAAFVVACVALTGAASRVAIAPDAILKHVKHLASDDLQGRGNGTKGLELAAEYIAAELRASGLEPGGARGSWFQPFELVTGLTLGEGNRLVIRANGTSVSFRLGETYLPLAATPNDVARVASAAVNAPLVFAGYGVAAPTLGYDDYEGVDVKGKAVIVFTHEPQEHQEDSRFDGRSPTNFSSLMTKAMVARARGAQLLIVVSDPTHDTDDAPYEEFVRDPQAENYGIPVLRIRRDAAKPLLEAWNLDRAAREIDASAAPRSRALDGASASYVEHLAKDRRTVRNVIGVLRGSDARKRSEAIVVGAHYDHLGLGGRYSMSADAAGEIHNGADDNASGTAALLEIARAAAATRHRFPRTVVFIAFAGEELGLVGSQYYVSNPTVPLNQTVAMLNLDMVGRPRGRIMLSGLESAPALNDDVDAAAATVPELDIERFQEGAGVGSSDDTSFALKRIPAIAFFSGFHGDYHRPSDDWDRIEARGAAAVATLAYELAARIAARPEPPEFVPRPPRTAHGGAGEAGPVSGYGPYFGSVPDFAQADAGVRFAEVREGSPAARAGLRAGDILIEFAGKPVRTLYDFTFALRDRRPGDEVAVKVLRDGSPLIVKVVLGSRR